MAPRWRRVLSFRPVWPIALAAALALGCSRPGPGNGEVAIAPAAPGNVAAANAASGGLVQTPGVPLDADHTVGPPIVEGNLAVFPIYAKVMEDIGDFVALDVALEKGVAVVREVGADPAPAGAREAPQAQAYRGDGARVNTLVIENKGDVPILVLAGTVLKGGKQDRQIGQDFIIGKRQTVPVDAFCVEHGRWNATRDGVATGGSFKSLKTLAVSGVRQAGQYEQDQGQVWNQVGQINRATGNTTASDTLTASLDAPEAQAARARTGEKIHAFLSSAPMAERTVGLAYAVGGEVQGARFFIHHKLFVQYEDTLVGTAVVESFTQRAVARAAGKPDASGACKPEEVASFVAGASRGKQVERTTQGDNVNAYQMSDGVYAAETKMKPASPAAVAPPKAVTKDFLKKH